MQRLDVFNWKEAKSGQKFQGRMHLRGTQPFAAFLTVEGYEVLAGYGAEIDVTFEGTGELRIVEAKGLEVFCHVKNRVGLEPRGEIYMNVDRKPHESAAMLEVKRALRELELGKRAALAEISAASRAAKAERKALKAKKQAVEAEAEAEAERLAAEAAQASQGDAAQQ